MIPIKTQNNIQNMLFKFIWANKKSRIKAELMQANNTKRELAVPNIFSYYYARQLAVLIDWWEDLQLRAMDTVPMNGFNSLVLCQ